MLALSENFKMATGNATGEKFFSCLPCSKQGRTGEAENYCVQCQEYLCSLCVTSHNSFSALFGHTLVGHSGGKEKASLLSVPTETCKTHTMKLIDFYCKYHDEVGCSVCINKYHGSCDPLYIPDHVKNNTLSSEATARNSRLSETIQKLNMLKRRRQQTRDELTKAKEKGLEDIRHYKEELQQFIERLEEVSIRELTEKYAELDAKVQKEMTDIADSLAQLIQRKTELESTQRNLSQIFVSAKLCAKNVEETEKYIAEYMKAPNEVLIFAKTSEILSYLINKPGLGKIQTLQSKWRCNITSILNGKL